MGEIAEALRRAKDHAPPAQILPSLDSSRDESADEQGDDPASPAQAVSPAVQALRELRESEIQPAMASESAVQFDITRELTGSRAERISLLDPDSPAAASVRQLAQQVKRQAALRGMRSLVITSPLSGDGKSTTACNLAIASTRLDRSRSVVLVELDLRRPSLSRCLGLEVEHGVDDVLEGTASLDEAVHETNVPGLSILAVREGRHAPERLLASEALRRLIRSLEEKYSMVIIDSPPVLSVADASSVIDIADGYLLVARAGRCPTASVRSAVEHLPAEKMLGCCLNFARRSKPVENYASYPTAPFREMETDDSPEERE